MNLREMTPPKVLFARYMLEDRLNSPGSTSGMVAERCRLGLAPRGEGYQGDGQETVRMELAQMLLLCRDLTPAEERCCRLRYSGSSGTKPYERFARLADLREGDGEEVLELSPHDHDGQPLGAEWVKVRGARAVMPSNAEIASRLQGEGVLTAEGLPMTAGVVERRLRDAAAKVAFALRAAIAKEELEERAAG